MRHRLAGSDQPLAAKVLAANAGIDPAVAPNLHAARNLGPLAHQRQARVEALRLAPVRPQVVAEADGGTLPDLAFLIADRPFEHRPFAPHCVEHLDRLAPHGPTLAGD